MKSMIQEGSSVQKAIENAWVRANRPKEFTIRVLEQEDKNFLGITTKPAVVSIIYKPERLKKSPEKNKKEIVGKVKSREASGIFGSLFGNNKQKKLEKRPAPKIDKYKKNVGLQKGPQVFWKTEFADTVISWLKEMLEIMKIKMSIDIRADMRILNVYLDKRVLRDAEEEKLFFISLSHLLMQFLKRKYKKRFSNYYLIIHTKTSRGNEHKK